MKDTRKKLIDMIKKDEELEMYEEAFKHKVKAIPKEEILDNRCSKYEFINFDKQETLEEAAEKEYPTINEQYQYDAFINGAKWQQKNSYSEEEVIDLLKALQIEKLINADRINIGKWFEQFKKK